MRVSELEKALSASGARWRADPTIRSDALPRFGLGGSRARLPIAEEVGPLDFRAVLKGVPSTTQLLQRRIEAGILRGTEIGIEEYEFHTCSLGLLPEDALPESGAVPSVVDWRNRWGWPWITSVRDQNGCQASWAFAAVALVEAMVRIEHCIWPHLSEGDLHKGMGAVCASAGDSFSALEWIADDHGLADPACFPWSTADLPWMPTRDRYGRSVRIPGPIHVGTVADQKSWIDTVGPLAAFVEVWTDFFGYGSGVYEKQDIPGNRVEGGHYMLIVGYDDMQGCWIVKNSWGAAWGEDGYARIGYGECSIDQHAKIAIVKTDPDPWTKRRHRAGGLLESGYGRLHRNFELFVREGQGMRHYWRDNDVHGHTWKIGEMVGNDLGGTPAVIIGTYDRNLEVVYPTNTKRLRHWWRDQSYAWHPGPIFGPADTAGTPGLIQSNYGAPGNLEVVVRTEDGQLNHWWRDSAGAWRDGGRFGSGIAFSGGTLLQSRYGAQGNFELVAVRTDGQMQHWWRDNDHDQTWNAGPTFGVGVRSSPVMIEGPFGQDDEDAVGNFELLVAVGGRVEHWWREKGGSLAWHCGATFGADVQRVCGLVQGSYGFNLETVVVRNDGKLRHFWRYGGVWNTGRVLP
jgi:hypothetical protein